MQKNLILKIRAFVLNRFPPRLIHKIDLIKNTILHKIEPEIGLIPRLASSEVISLDIGPHMGLFPALMGRHSLRVLAFEPQKRLFDYLKKIGLPLTTVEHIALSDQTGEVELRVPIEVQSGVPLEAYETIHQQNTFSSLDTCAITRETASMCCLDDYPLEGSRLGSIKIDVKGHELIVLRGAIATLEQHHPKLMVEISHHYNPAWRQTFELLESLDYSAYRLPNPGRSLALETCPSQCLKVERVDSNFIFLLKLAFTPSAGSGIPARQHGSPNGEQPSSFKSRTISQEATYDAS